MRIPRLPLLDFFPFAAAGFSSAAAVAAVAWGWGKGDGRRDLRTAFELARDTGDVRSLVCWYLFV